MYIAHFAYNHTRVEIEVPLKYSQGYFYLKRGALDAQLI
jgi:hypothetical protein